ncbi:MAG: hypothetical protein O2815_10095 [Actinomycetota bacterium]|nr:hypothetical protein [Actinomycetota bacterium]
MARPLVQKGIAELEKLVSGAAGDPKTVNEVIAELRHRSTPRAKRLLADLLDRSESKETSTPGRGSRPRRASSEEAKKSNGGPHEGGAVPPVATRTLEEAYELLRQTFTEDSEILARWGMTSAMPEPVRELVLEEWGRRVATGPDEFGRTLERLTQDVERLRANKIRSVRE